MPPPNVYGMSSSSPSPLKPWPSPLKALTISAACSRHSRVRHILAIVLKADSALLKADAGADVNTVFDNNNKNQKHGMIDRKENEKKRDRKTSGRKEREREREREREKTKWQKREKTEWQNWYPRKRIVLATVARLLFIPSQWNYSTHLSFHAGD